MPFPFPELHNNDEHAGQVEGGVVEMTDGERALDPVTRAASALGRVARPGLSKAWSVSSPNMAQLGAHTGTRDT